MSGPTDVARRHRGAAVWQRAASGANLDQIGADQGIVQKHRALDVKNLPVPAPSLPFHVRFAGHRYFVGTQAIGLQSASI